MGGRSHREIRLSLGPSAVILPKITPRHELSSQQYDADSDQEELYETPEPNLDFCVRVRLLRSNLLPSGKPFVPLAFAFGPFLVFLLLFVPVLLVPDYKRKFESPF